MKKPTVVSLFSGCGGMDLGFIRAGFDVALASDNNSYACEVYQHNIGEILHEDVRTLSPELLPSGDVFLAGFPCQPFSSAGNRLADLDDRGNLYLECLRFIKAQNPAFVVFENVTGILTAKNKDGSSFIQTVLNLLEDCGLGYNTYMETLFGPDFGVPQKRKRVFIVGVRKDLNITYNFPDKVETPFELLTVGHVINMTTNLVNQNDIMPFSPQSKALIPYIKEGGSWKDIPYEVLPERLKKIRDDMRKYKSPTFFRRFARNEINGTITATASPEKCGIIHPLEDRRYSVREVARFQSFPDDFIFTGNSMASKYRVIGNAVPPLLAYHIALSIKEFFPL